MTPAAPVSGTPPNWYRAPGAPASGPLVILDLDGVISDASHRQHFLRGARKDWSGFFTSAALDPPYEKPVWLWPPRSPTITRWPSSLPVPTSVVDITRGWLADHDVRHDLLILRPERGQGKWGPSADFKRHELSRLRAAGYEVAVAIDDDERIIDMYRSEGVFALYVHSGYYER